MFLISPPIAAAQTPEGGEGADGPVAVLELSDSTLIQNAWRTIYPDSAVPEGGYQILIPSGPMLSPRGRRRQLSATVVLLRNGTEAGRMDRGAWDALAAAAERKAGPDWAESMEGPEKQDVPLLWHALRLNRATWLRWSEWPAGFAVAVGSSISPVPTVKPEAERDIDFAWDQKLFGHFLLGASLHRSQFGGGLSRLGETVADTAGGKAPGNTNYPFWSDADWWWTVSAGVPGLKYTLALADQAVPPYFWLETGSDQAIRGHKPGRVVSQWTGPALRRPGNLSHTFDARLGVLHYGIRIDPDAYRFPIHTVGLDDLPALFGRWGAGLIVASDVMATRLWMDIPDLELRLGHPEAYPSRFRFAFLHFDMAYRSSKSFSIGTSVRIRIDNPVMNRPGA